jgi:RNA polymerase sigma-32 factor
MTESEFTMATRINPSASQPFERRMMRKAMQAPYLEREEEQELAIRWRDHKDPDALHQLTTAYMRLVISIATKFRHYGLPMGDLIQEGNVGLMQAAARFDPDREVRFSTYAVWWIRSQIQDYVLRNWSIVRTGTTSSQKSLFFNLRRLRAMLDDGAAQRLSPENRAEIAVKLKVRPDEVESMESRLSGSDFSLNTAMSDASDDGADWLDMLADDRSQPEEDAIETLDGEHRRAWLDGALKTLNERELAIIRARRLTDDDSVTLEELGNEMGISKERVRQIEARALEKLKAALVAGADGDPAAHGYM